VHVVDELVVEGLVYVTGLDQIDYIRYVAILTQSSGTPLTPFN